MAGPLTQAGAAPEPTEYATLAMDRHITGLWTQRSLLRDADVPYLYGKFYSASRYDSLCDGLNREITARLTSARAPGSSVYSGGYPGAAIFSYYSYKWIQDGVENLHVLADTNDQIFDITPGSHANLFNKSLGAGLKTRFCGVNTELFFCDTVNQKKWLRGGKAWAASKTFTVGDLIIDSNGNVQVFESQAQTFDIVEIQVVSKTLLGGTTQTFLIVTIAGTVATIPSNQPVTFSGLTTYTALNGQTLIYRNIASSWGLNLSTSQIAFAYSASSYGPTSDTGNVATFVEVDAEGNDITGTTGSSAPPWSSTPFTGVTQDNTVTWTCYGSPLQDWGIPAPTTKPGLAPGAGMRYWQPNLNLTGLIGTFSVLDNLNNVQVASAYPGPGTSTGTVQPNWNTSLGGYTYEGGIQWINCGTVGPWYANTTYQFAQVILDNNGYLQYITGLASPGKSGTTNPGFNTTVGGTTSDNNLTWTNIGPGTQLVDGGYQYGYSYHAIDGSVSTMSQPVYQQYGALGPAGGFINKLTVTGITNAQIDQIWLFRTAQGQATPVYLDSIPNPGTATAIEYDDVIPDTSTVGQQALIAQIPAPISHENDPPPAGITAPMYHLGRVWGIVGNQVVYSGGPDTVTGNGNTAFPPLNSFALPEQPIKLRPITTNNGGMVVYTTSNTYLIQGAGNSASPFIQPQMYMGGVGILSYDAEDIVGSTSYLFTTKSKFISLDPSAGYVECGFPIGDQFTEVTTGGITAALYNPASTYVTWHEASSGDTGLYVADGAVGWFRYSPVASPESGYVWSPRRAIVGGTSAVQSVETSPGINSLLIGPSASTGGAILMRDTTVFTDNGTAYPSWQTIGNIVLCESGQIAEVAHIALKSPARGARPSVSVLFGELYATTDVPWDLLKITSNDPPDLPASKTMFSDRYTCLQNGVAPLCDNFQLKIDYGTQAVNDELLKHSIYGAHHEERRQQ